MMFLEIKNPLMSLEHQHSDLAETNKAKKKCNYSLPANEENLACQYKRKNAG